MYTERYAHIDPYGYQCVTKKYLTKFTDFVIIVYIDKDEVIRVLGYTLK